MVVAYRSTRGTESVSFEEALLRGLAPDGGLYVPVEVPTIDFGALPRSSFGALGSAVLRQWLGGELDDADVDRIASEALNFPVPIIPLRGGAWDGVFVLELFHGPTLSFKDFGARTMARLMGRFLQERSQEVTILVATSGDTGSAVADGFAGQDRLRVVLLYPKGKVSPVQERQLIVERPGVRALAVDGDFDDCQRMVKEALMDERLDGLRLSSANSINIGRLLPQMLYYAWAALQLEAELLFCVPSGNLGNLTGGVLAHHSGLRVRSFLAAHNANDFFPSFLKDERASFASTVRTLSNAMDVGAPSNFERLEAMLSQEQMRALIRGCSVTDAETLESMKRVYEETGYVADPHTAVGLEAVRRARSGDGFPVAVLSTAHPAKFPETVERALGFEPGAPDRLAAFWERGVSVRDVAVSSDALRDVLLGDAG